MRCAHGLTEVSSPQMNLKQNETDSGGSGPSRTKINTVPEVSGLSLIERFFMTKGNLNLTH